MYLPMGLLVLSFAAVSWSLWKGSQVAPEMGGAKGATKGSEKKHRVIGDRVW